MATHSSILVWRIPWTEEPGGLESIRSQRVRNVTKHARKHLMGLLLISGEKMKEVVLSTYLYRGKEILQVLQSFLHGEVGLPNPVKYLNFQRCSELARTPSMEDSVR